MSEQTQLPEKGEKHAHGHGHGGFHGPKCWVISAIVGAALGLLLCRTFPPEYTAEGLPIIPLWLCAPFAMLLASIALMPFVSMRFWHNHFPDFAFLLGAVVAAYYISGYTRPDAAGHAYGSHTMLHAIIEFYSFIALVGGLFVVSGGILVEVDKRSSRLGNLVLLAVGALLANVVGTTGASMLLIRPFMRMNTGRLRPTHVVFFIFIVSNCGGALTPIGDPPLYLGFLKGVPFFWTLSHLWPDWLAVVGALLVIFAVYDYRVSASDEPAPATGTGHVRFRGAHCLVCLALMVAGVFIDPILKQRFGIEGIPVGATFQILVAAAAYALSRKEILAANDFSFFPVKEVGLLFLGIFATMAPALGYLAIHGSKLGISTPTAFYFATGALSAVLDNAPTYLNFLQVAFGDREINAISIAEFLSSHDNARLLHAISTGAVFFGAMTYIGNGPNFMVKAIAESAEVKMPGFFGYLGRALAILLPVLVVNWFVFVLKH